MAVLDNARHEAFAQGLAKGLSASEAYVKAGYKANDGNAATLKGKQRVQDRVAELQQKAAVRTAITMERITDMLNEDRELARSLGQASAAVAATEKLGKLHGLFVERSENVNTNYNISDEPMTDEEWEAEHATVN